VHPHLMLESLWRLPLGRSAAHPAYHPREIAQCPITGGRRAIRCGRSCTPSARACEGPSSQSHGELERCRCNTGTRLGREGLTFWSGGDGGCAPRRSVRILSAILRLLDASSAIGLYHAHNYVLATYICIGGVHLTDICVEPAHPRAIYLSVSRFLYFSRARFLYPSPPLSLAFCTPRVVASSYPLFL
jgi:hypothetical protein